MNPDENLRRRMQELAATELKPLSDQARARIRQTTLESASARKRARWEMVLPLVAAAGLTVLFWPEREANLPAPREGAPANTGPVATANPTQATTTAQPAAAACGEVIVASFSRDAASSQRLDLGPRALFVAEARSEVRTLALETCSTRVLLSRGALFVHARDLKGGELVVESPLGTVEVKGTIFGVRVNAQELRVTVDEGKVRVTPRTGESVLLGTGQSLTVRAGYQPKLTKLSATIREEVVPSEVTGEKVWQQGALQPSPEPFDPGTSLTEEGRPMHKPRVVEQGATP